MKRVVIEGSDLNIVSDDDTPLAKRRRLSSQGSRIPNEEITQPQNNAQSETPKDAIDCCLKQLKSPYVGGCALTIGLFNGTFGGMEMITRSIDCYKFDVFTKVFKKNVVLDYGNEVYRASISNYLASESIPQLTNHLFRMINKRKKWFVVNKKEKIVKRMIFVLNSNLIELFIACVLLYLLVFFIVFYFFFFCLQLYLNRSQLLHVFLS